MDAHELSFARILFQNKVLKAHGQAYEDLFTTVMTYHNPNFSPVKPQGKIGDRKNDGFDRTTGAYYQVYAPEKLSAKKNAAVKKLQQDFHGLKAFWNAICKIERFYFALNDKYQGTDPTLEQELAAIKKNHGLSETKPFLCKDLEACLAELTDAQIILVVGSIPKLQRVEIVQYAALNDIVEYLHKSPNLVTDGGLLTAPDFAEKIEFNGLGPTVATLLNTGSFQFGTLNNYFELNGEFGKDNLRKIFSALYETSKANHQAVKNINSADIVFFEILEAVIPKKTQPYYDAAIALMALFFEACDIFEEPKKTQ